MKKTFLILIALLLSIAGLNARTFALCTAVSSYERPGLRPLTQTTKDAKSMAQLLKTKITDVSLITGNNATERNIKQTLSKIAASAGANDQIIFFFSGHGGDGVFCLYDQNMKYYDLLKILSSSKCKNILVLIDACESGSLAQAISTLKSEGAWNSNVASLVSSRAGESSIETKIVGAGFLAQGVMKAMRGKADANADKKLTVKELFTYTFNDVTTRAERMGAHQHPQLIAPQAMHNNVVWFW